MFVHILLNIAQNFAEYFCWVYCTKYCSVLHKVLFCFAQSIVHAIAQLYCVQKKSIYCTCLFGLCT